MKTNEPKSYQANELNAGFTLIEFLVIFTLMGILLVIASPFYGGFVRNVDLDSTADVVVSDLRNTQVQAMSGQDGEKWGICFRNPIGDNNDFYEIISPTADMETECTNIGTSTASTIDRTVYLPNGISFTIPAGAATVYVIFNNINGTATVSTGSTIAITSQQETKTITITAVGLISHD